MTQQEQPPHPDEKRKVLRVMQTCMRNFAFHHLKTIDLRTLTALQRLDLFDKTTEPYGSDIDMDTLRTPLHPRRGPSPRGPLLFYSMKGESSQRVVVELSTLFLSEVFAVRKAALTEIERRLADMALKVTPKTADLLARSGPRLCLKDPREWRQAAISLHDAFADDLLVALQGARQSIECDPAIQEFLNAYAERVLRPTISSLDSIALEVRNPEAEHPKLAESVASVVGEASNLREACEQYFARLGHVALAAPYGMAEVVSRWMAAHPDTDAWSDVWAWAHGAFGPVPTYHACSVFVVHPHWVPAEKLPVLWDEIAKVVCVPNHTGEVNLEQEPWALRRDLARHYVHHLEASVAGGEGGNIACFAWWLAEQVASLFPDEPESAKFYRKEWIAPAVARSAHVWLAASPGIAPSFLRYVTDTSSSPWASALLALMGDKLEELAPQQQAKELQASIERSLVSCLMESFPVATEPPAEPTYAQECSLRQTALKWAAFQEEDDRRTLEQILAMSQTLDSREGLCAALRKLHEKSLVDQIAVALALKAKAYTDPAVAPGVWEVLSDEEWRTQVLGAVQERVLGLLIEAFSLFQVGTNEEWLFRLPHYIAGLCEKTEDVERLRQLFLYVIHTSRSADTVSAICRLLRGPRKADLVGVAEDCRQRVESAWDQYPPWVQGRQRGLLPSLHAV